MSGDFYEGGNQFRPQEQTKMCVSLHIDKGKLSLFPPCKVGAYSVLFVHVFVGCRLYFPSIFSILLHTFFRHQACIPFDVELGWEVMHPLLDPLLGSYVTSSVRQSVSLSVTQK